MNDIIKQRLHIELEFLVDDLLDKSSCKEKEILEEIEEWSVNQQLNKDLK